MTMGIRFYERRISEERIASASAACDAVKGRHDALAALYSETLTAMLRERSREVAQEV